MKTDTVAILGANSAIGWEMLRLLQARNFPVETLLPLDTDGGAVIFRGKRIPVHPISDYAFTGADLVLGASDGDTARRFAPAIARAGAVFVDSSPAFRLEETVPLVVPEVNPADIQSHRGIIASPNGVTTIALTAIAPLQALSGRVRRGRGRPGGADAAGIFPDPGRKPHAPGVSPPHRL